MREGSLQFDSKGLPNRVHYFFTANIALAAMAVFFVTLRLFSKIVVLRSFGWDDGMMIMGLLCSVTSTVILCLQTRYGLAYHMADVDPVLYVGFFKIMYAAILLYIFTCLFVKVSIVLFYRRLGHEKKYVRAVWFLIILNILVCITMSLPAAFSCRPVAFFWDTSLDGKCIEQQKLYTVNSALNVFLDFSILLLPIPIVWKAQMPLKRRLMIIALFGLGGFVCIASLIRVTKLFGPASAQDITWAAVDSHTWSMIEVNAGIIAGCVPTLKPLFRSCFSFLNTTNNSRPTYESDFKDGSGGGGKRSWKYNSRNIALGSAISKSSGQPSPKVLGKMYQSQLTKSDEELMMAQDQREIWRTTEVKVDIEAGSPHAKEQKEEV